MGGGFWASSGRFLFAEYADLKFIFGAGKRHSSKKNVREIRPFDFAPRLRARGG